MRPLFTSHFKESYLFYFSIKSNQKGYKCVYIFKGNKNIRNEYYEPKRNPGKYR